MGRKTQAGASLPSQVAAVIEPRDIAREAEESYRLYAMMTIGERALPDARDGLKPVQRRILLAMVDQGLRAERPRQKCATIVGATLGRYHPHGDSAVYETLVRMGQHWVMAVPMIDPQGNFGSQDGDPAAAYRYTEARMTAAAGAMLEDLDLGVVDRVPTYDDRSTEAVVLPSRLPNLLLNGAKGIAVGLATSIPPHNLAELGAAIRHLCDDPKIKDDVLLGCVLGPDFPTGGEMLVDEALRDAYLGQVGRVRVRATVHQEQLGDGRTALVVTEMPYATDKGPAVDKLARLVRQARDEGGKFGWAEGIAAIRDESTDTVRVVVELKRGTPPAPVLEGLWTSTDFATSVSMHMLALVDGAPRQLSLREALEVFIAHRLSVVKRRAEAHESEASARAHIVAGLQAALIDLDAVVALVRAADNPTAARTGLMKMLTIDAVQADAILALRLSQLTKLDAVALTKEADALAADLRRLAALLASPNAMRRVVRDEVAEDVARFGVPRRTRVVAAGEQTVTEVPVVRQGLAVSPREGVGPSVRDREARMVEIGPDRPLWVFTSAGRVGRATPDGLEPLETKEQILLAWSGGLPEEGDVVAWYANGLMKRMPVAALSDRSGWGSFAKLEDGDRLVSVRVTAHDRVLTWAATAGGKGILTPLSSVPTYGRAARGVVGIKLADGDKVVAAGCVAEAGEVEVRLFGGTPLRGKAFPLADWPRQGRAGQGVQLLGSGDAGPVRAVHLVGGEGELWYPWGPTKWSGAPEAPTGTRAARLRHAIASGSTAPGRTTSGPLPSDDGGMLGEAILWHGFD